MIETLKIENYYVINIRLLNTDMSANATTEKKEREKQKQKQKQKQNKTKQNKKNVNSPCEQGEKSGKSRPTRQNIMKKKNNTSTVPVSLLLEAI